MTRNIEHMVMPEWMQDVAPGTTIAGGETHPPRATVRLNGPPGTGKTMEITKRVAYLVEEVGVEPSDITLVTYRRSLAGAVESRLRDWGVLDEDVGSDTDLKFWTTIHAAANRATGLLAEASRGRDASGLGPAVAEREKVAFCKGVLNIEYFTDEPWEKSRGKLLLRLFGYCRNNLLDPLEPADVRKAPQYDPLMEE